MSSSNEAYENNADESLIQHMMRSTKNCFTRCFGGIQSTDERAKIKLKEIQMKKRKQQFGVDYMNLVLNSSSDGAVTTPEELTALVDQCKADLAKTQGEIDELKAEIERIDRVTNSKLVPKPGTATSSPTAPVPMSMTPAAAAMPIATIPEPVVAEAPIPAPTANLPAANDKEKAEEPVVTPSAAGQMTTESMASDEAPATTE